jgi:hypothetical protein
VENDPAGHALWRDLLRRQGLRVVALQGALSSLRAPAPGERAAAVVVDCQETDLDAATRAHLADWVAQGGTLVLLGEPSTWPGAFAAQASRAVDSGTLAVRPLLGRGPAAGDGDGASDSDSDSDAEDDSAGQEARYGTPEHASLALRPTFAFAGSADVVASFDAGGTYAAVHRHEAGRVFGVASDELTTNVALLRPGNAAAMVALFSSVDRTELRVAEESDGVSPPSTPLAGFQRAGLGLGLVHGVVAALLLFLAEGVRMARPRPDERSRRLAFAEHVEAVGRLYERARAAPHALAAYARFAEERLRARMPRGANDVAAFLSLYARRPPEECRRLWARAQRAKDGGPPAGDELAVLAELSEACDAAMAREA